MVQIFDLRTNNSHIGSVEDLVSILPLTRADINFIVMESNRGKIKKGYSSRRDIYTLYSDKEKKVTGDYKKLLVETGLNDLTLTRLINNPHLMIKGWSLNEDLVSISVTEKVHVNLYHIDGGNISGDVYKLSHETNIPVSVIKRLVNHSLQLYQGWSASETVSERLLILYKNDIETGKVVCVKSTSYADLVIKSDLTYYMVKRLLGDGDLVFNGWSSSRESALNPQIGRIALPQKRYENITIIRKDNPNISLTGDFATLAKSIGVSVGSLRGLIIQKNRMSVISKNGVSWVGSTDRCIPNLNHCFVMSDGSRFHAGTIKELYIKFGKMLSKSQLSKFLMSNQTEGYIESQSVKYYCHNLKVKSGEQIAVGNVSQISEVFKLDLVGLSEKIKGCATFKYKNVEIEVC